MRSTLFKNQSPSDIEALWFSDTFIYKDSPTQNLSRWELLHAAKCLSLEITSTQPLSAIILFQQRHIFLIASLAIALKKGRVILPPNTTENTLKNLQNDLPNLWLFGDKMPSMFQNENHVSSQHIENIIASVKNYPPPFCFDALSHFFATIKASEIWLYTSGSTGLPKRVVKTWQNMIDSANLAISRFNLMTPCFIVTTVPNQHMFGLESSIFWPLLSKASLWHDRPMFPEDIISALSANTQQPALLVSTPLHIKKLIAFKLDWPKHLNRLLSATAPMPCSLAQKTEQQMKVQVFEVYGSTETASIASKQSTFSELWQPYQDVEFQEISPKQYAVKTAGLDKFQPLNDQIEFINPPQFKLGKRDDDLIKIAGKRISLSELNRSLCAIKGISDGVFIQPKHAERLAAFVVTTLSSTKIQQALRKMIDPVFLPRPIIFLSVLPRNDVGKILHNQLLKNLSAQ
ncbi:MAG: AMP-binding protein [Thiomicrorhabdus sp.]|nr:AMP-binding protein [Thiomicrorhabdus sp.]